jgi:hypothetical protein
MSVLSVAVIVGLCLGVGSLARWVWRTSLFSDYRGSIVSRGQSREIAKL